MVRRYNEGNCRVQHGADMDLLLIPVFVAGLVMLIKGGFRLAGRYVSKRDGRMAGLTLMAPFTLQMCLALSLSMSLMSAMSDEMLVDENGSVSINSAVFETYLNESINQMMSYQALVLGVLAVSVAGAALIIWRSPQAGQPTLYANPPSAANPPAVNPKAKPKREHPLGGYGIYSPAPPPQPAAPKSIMTVAEAAAYIGQTSADVERLIDQNRLPASRSTSGYRIARSALDDLLNGEL